MVIDDQIWQITVYGNLFPSCQPSHGDALLGSMRKIDHWPAGPFKQFETWETMLRKICPGR